MKTRKERVNEAKAAACDGYTSQSLYPIESRTPAMVLCVQSETQKSVSRMCAMALLLKS